MKKESVPLRTPRDAREAHSLTHSAVAIHHRIELRFGCIVSGVLVSQFLAGAGLEATFGLLLVLLGRHIRAGAGVVMVGLRVGIVASVRVAINCAGEVSVEAGSVHG